MIQNIIVFLIFGLAAAYLAFYLYRKLSGGAGDCECGCSGCPESAACMARGEWRGEENAEETSRK